MTVVLVKLPADLDETDLVGDPSYVLEALHGVLWRAEAHLLARQAGMTPCEAQDFAKDPTSWYHREDFDGVEQWQRHPQLVSLVEQAVWQLLSRDGRTGEEVG